jgi:hypothetical protein
MYYPTPFDVLKKTILATADETDRRDLSALAVIPLVFKPLWRLEVLETHEPPPVWWIAGNCIASKPSWENGYLYRRRYAFRITSIDRWRSEFRWPVPDNASIFLEALMKQSLKARFLNDLECLCSKHLPVIET